MQMVQEEMGNEYHPEDGIDGDPAKPFVADRQPTFPHIVMQST